MNPLSEEVTQIELYVYRICYENNKGADRS